MSNVNFHMIYDINMVLVNLLENQDWRPIATEQCHHYQLHTQLLYLGRVLVFYLYPHHKMTYKSFHAAWFMPTLTPSEEREPLNSI